MRDRRRLASCLIVVLGFWHGDLVFRACAPALALLGKLLAPEWSLQWAVDGPAMELVLGASPRTPRFLAPSVTLPVGVDLEARVPLRHLLLPVALAGLGLALARPPHGARRCVVLAAWLLMSALVHALGLIELPLAREAARLGYEPVAAPWLLLMRALEAGGRWTPCVMVALAVQRVAWRSVQRHQEAPTTDAINAGSSHS